MAIELLSTVPQSVAPDGAVAEGAIGAAGTDSASPLETKQPVRKLRLGATWVILARTSGIGITMLINIALARWLSPEEFGDFLLLSSVLSLGSLLAMLGLNTAIVRFVAESLGRNDVPRARQSMRLITAVAIVSVLAVAGLASLALSYFDARVLGLPAVAGLVPLAIASLVLLTIIQLVAEACRSLHDLRLASLFSGGQTGGLLSNLVFMALIAAAIFAGKTGFLTAVALNLVAMAVCLPLAVAGLTRTARARFAVAEGSLPATPLSTSSLLAYALPVLVIQLLTFATTQGDLWIAGIYCPHDELALYGAARRLMLLVAMPLQMLNLTVISSIAEMHAQHRLDDLQRLLRNSASLAAWPSIVAIALLIFAGGPILHLLFGPYFVQAALPLGILAVGQIVLVFAGSSNIVLAMTGNQLGALLINVVTALALAGIGIWAASRFGIVGMALASAGVIATQSLGTWILARKLVGVWTHPVLRPQLHLN